MAIIPLYANPCRVFSTLHAVFERMRIRMCSECYVRCVHKYMCTYDQYSRHLLECDCNLVGVLRAVVAFEKCQYGHKLKGLVI
jgi:hypothetical protein